MHQTANVHTLYDAWMFFLSLCKLETQKIITCIPTQSNVSIYPGRSLNSAHIVDIQ